jgi:hypothetical protein
LQVVVIAADVKLSEGVLHDIGRLQEDLIELHVRAARLGGDLRTADGVARGAGLRLDAGARCVQSLRGDDDALKVGNEGWVRVSRSDGISRRVRRRFGWRRAGGRGGGAR